MGKSVLVEQWFVLRAEHDPAVTATRRLRFLLEQVLENQRAPGLAPGLHQRSAFVELPEIHGREAEALGEVRHLRRGSFVIARQEYDAMAALHVRVGGQGAREQVVEALHESGAREGRGREGRGREAVEIFDGVVRVHRVDDRLALPVRERSEEHTSELQSLMRISYA